jgi:hypothetical protein
VNSLSFGWCSGGYKIKEKGKSKQLGILVELKNTLNQFRGYYFKKLCFLQTTIYSIVVYD